MGRELRRVPANWKHPRSKTRDGFEPLYDDYIGSLEYYVKDVNRFIKELKTLKKEGKVTVWGSTFKKEVSLVRFFLDPEEGSLRFPDYKDFMPYGDWYQLYENVSEGCPLSPPFETKKELIDWLTTHKDYWDYQWSKEGARAIVGRGYAPSAVISNGKLLNSEQSLLIK